MQKSELDTLKAKYSTKFNEGNEQFIYGVRLEQSGE